MLQSVRKAPSVIRTSEPVETIDREECRTWPQAPQTTIVVSSRPVATQGALSAPGTVARSAGVHSPRSTSQSAAASSLSTLPGRVFEAAATAQPNPVPVVIDVGPLQGETDTLCYTVVATGAQDLQRLCDEQQKQVSFVAPAWVESLPRDVGFFLSAAAVGGVIATGVGLQGLLGGLPLMLATFTPAYPVALLSSYTATDALLAMPFRKLLPYMAETSHDAADLLVWGHFWRQNRSFDNDPQWAAKGRALVDYLVEKQCLECIDGTRVVDGDAAFYQDYRHCELPAASLVVRVQQAQQLRDIIAASPAGIWSPGAAGAHQRERIADGLTIAFACGHRQRLQAQLTAIQQELALRQKQRNACPGLQQFLLPEDAAEVALEQRAEKLSAALQQWQLTPAPKTLTTQDTSGS